MFDTSGSLEGIIADGNQRRELFHEPEGLNSETWHMNQQDVQELNPTASFSMDSNYLPSLINLEIEVPMDHQLQCCGVNEERDMGLDCLEREELMNVEWVESQQCSSFLFWDQSEGPLCGDEIAPASSNMGTMLSSYP
ncbi:hypothetical protein Acr_15g0000650 [Actinidia rufa]|uniref:Uncharacterized protein n=1 Tax=Actinidia rufa TaxID=165716 RepID=A0A7J0FRW8_9ERIC|nr:hypothetical protein Acr_15g0000650 [Actinidia rufa]